MTTRQPYNQSGIFFDSTNLVEFQKWINAKILGGATTNPLIAFKEGVTNFDATIAQMVRSAGPHFPISVEIPDTTLSIQEMVVFARKYHQQFPDNIVIKVPMDPREPQKAFEVIYLLGRKKIRVNATIGLSLGQLIAASEALRESKAAGDNYVSLFWSRRNEAYKEHVAELVKSGIPKNQAIEHSLDASQTLTNLLTYLKTHASPVRTIVGSIRITDQIDTAFGLGADIVAISPKLLAEWMYTQRGVETVEQFNQASRNLKKGK